MRLELEPLQHRRSGRQWVEGAEEVDHGVAAALRAHGATDLVGLEQHDVPAAVGERRRRDEAVDATADDDGVDQLSVRARVTERPCRRAAAHRARRAEVVAAAGTGGAIPASA